MEYKVQITDEVENVQLKQIAMILSFSEIEFKEKIINGKKIHTIRRDSRNRWQVGSKIDFWLGEPEEKNKKVVPHQFGVGEVSKIEGITLDFRYDEIMCNEVIIGEYGCICYTPNTPLNTIYELNDFAIKDGFKDWHHLKHFFLLNYGDIMFTGKLIYWDNFKSIY